MRILVTGASGFIGGNVVQFLAASKRFIIVATGRSRTDRFRDLTNVTYVPCDLLGEIPQQHCEVCIHCAGLADDQSTAHQFQEANVVATRRLLESIIGCQVFVFISSSSVYDFSDQMEKKEEDASLSDRLSMYGQSKLKAEELVRSSGVKSIYILRPRAVYGPGDRVLLPRILRLIKRNRMWVPGKLSIRSSLTHVQNLCEVILESVEQARPGLATFNVADKMDYDLNQVFKEILRKKNPGGELFKMPTSVLRVLVFFNSLIGREGQLTRQSLDYITLQSTLNTDRAEKEVGYRGEFNFWNSLGDLEVR